MIMKVIILNWFIWITNVISYVNDGGLDSKLNNMWKYILKVEV